MFEAEFNNTQLEEEAKEVCGDDKFCLFDIAATKRVEVGAATMVDGEMFDTIVEMAVPSKCISYYANSFIFDSLQSHVTHHVPMECVLRITPANVMRALREEDAPYQVRSLLTVVQLPWMIDFCAESFSYGGM